MVRDGFFIVASCVQTTGGNEAEMRLSDKRRGEMTNGSVDAQKARKLKHSR
jgi:hypothetical protein